MVTGSRYFSDSPLLVDTLNKLNDIVDNSTALMHGNCSGLDIMAARVWEESGRPTIAFNADWYHCDSNCYHSPRSNGYCPAAGPRRNQRMVDCGADLLLAFPINESRGTYDCIRRAKKAHIPVIIINQREEHNDVQNI